MKHKHYELIMAWANGEKIQYLTPDKQWKDVSDNKPAWNSTTEYRIKPQDPKTLAEATQLALLALQTYPDCEVAHCRADELLCEFLVAIGYVDVVQEYNKINKWYA